MTDIFVYTKKGKEQPPALPGQIKTHIYSDKYVYIGTTEPLKTEQIFQNDDMVCVVLGRALEPLTAKSIGEGLLDDGAQSLGKLNGHFVVVFYSTKQRNLSMFRDRVGFQHGYYYCTPSNLIFSTSLGFILDACFRWQGITVRPSTLGLAYYISFQYLPSPHTMFEDIWQIAPGEMLSATPWQELRKVSSWFPSPALEATDPDFEDCASAVREILYRSFGFQMDASKRTVAFLSGGMDTSTNIAIQQERLKTNPTALIATFKEKGYDEFAWAEIVVRHFNLDYIPVLIEPGLIDHLPQIVRLYENPLGDKSVFAEYFLCDVARANGFSQLVTGEGGDEILGLPRSREGTEKFQDLPRDNSQLAHFYFELTSVSFLPIRNKMLSYLQVDPNLGNHYLEAIYDHFVGHDPLERLYYGQWKTWLIEDVLMKDSRAASSCGLDLVAPFMTPELMQYMSQLSPAMKKLCLTDKNLLRIAMMKSLPKTILHKPKHKFWLPFAEWFRHEWRDCLRETLLASESFVCSSYGRRNIASLIDQHQLGTQDHNRVLWSLLFLEKWYHEFVRRRVDVV